MPTEAFKNGDFSALPQGIFDPSSTAEQPDGTYTRAAFSGNIIPPADFSKVSENIIKLAPTPAPTLPGYFHNIQSVSNLPKFNQDVFTGKFDQNLTDKQKLSFYYSANNYTRFNGGGYSYLPVPGTASSGYALQSVYGTMIRLSYDWTITPSLLNHFAGGYNNFDNDHVSASYGGNWPTKLGLTGVQELTFPDVRFNAGTTAQGSAMTQMGNNTYGDSPNGSYIFADDMTWIHGAHAIRWGAEIRKYYYIEPWNWGASGNFQFRPYQTADPNNSTTTGYTFASFLLGDVGTASLPVQAVKTTTTDTWNPAFYISDDWKVNKRLTLNLGVRWEIAGAETETHGISSTLDPTLANPGAGGYPGALAFLADTHRSSWQNPYYGEIGPRLGFAYQLNSHLVLRGGYSLMYTPPIANSFGEAYIDGYSNTFSLGQQGIFPVFNWDNGFPAYPYTLPDKDPSLDNGSTIQYIARNSAKQPYAQNYTLSVQYLLGDKTIIQASYVGTKGSRLGSANFSNMNQLNPKYLSYGDALLDDISMGSTLTPVVNPPYAGFTGNIAQALLPYPQYQGGGVVNRFAYFGKSHYDALQMTATRNFSKGLGFIIAYSWQKTLTNTDANNIYYAGASQDVYNRGLEKSVAAFDHPQNLRLTWIYELPFGKGRPFLNKGGILNEIVGGWNITANQQYQSGDVLSISSGVDTSFYLYNGTVRANYVPGQSLNVGASGPFDYAGGTGIQWFNPNAFAAPPTTLNGVVSSLGDTPRYIGNLRGPWQPSENFGIYKRFPFGEGRFFEIRADAFNAFNRSGIGDPDTTVGDSTFGRITDVESGPRNIQVAGADHLLTARLSLERNGPPHGGPFRFLLSDIS